jgi:uncharacterized phiE125 gp8 family phage protein
MIVTTLAPPASEPVLLADVKAYLRLAHSGEDALAESLARAARARIEALTGLALIRRTVRARLDRWPVGTVETRRLALPVRPAGELLAVRVFAPDGSAEDVTGRFVLEAGRAAQLVWTQGAFPWPKRRLGGIEIDYQAGFGPAPGDVPDSLRLAVIRFAAHGYESRDKSIGAKLPEDVAGLLAPWRRVRL